MMSSRPSSGDDNHHVGHLMPILRLIGVVGLLSSITSVMKNVFLHSDMSFLDVARERVLIGFLILAVMTVCLDWRGVRTLRFQDSLHLAGVGVLGVASYTIAAWGLMYTSVTYYAVVYSLLPTFTAIFSYCLGTQYTHSLTWRSDVQHRYVRNKCPVSLGGKHDMEDRIAAGEFFVERRGVSSLYWSGNRRRVFAP